MFVLACAQLLGTEACHLAAEEIEVWAVKEAKANPLDTRNKKWSAILKDRPFANDLLQCMQQHGFTRGAQDMVDLYRTLSTHTHQAPPLQALSVSVCQCLSSASCCICSCQEQGAMLATALYLNCLMN